MKRLTSDKAKKALEAFAKKQLDVANVEMKFAPYFQERNINDLKNHLCRIDVNVTYNDGKGYSAPLLVEKNAFMRFNLGYVIQRGISFAKLARRIENFIKHGATIGINSQALFYRNFTIEQALVEADLSYKEADQ